ncbi:MAG TPA: hypothetical protein VFD43_12560 [Planctomycetota bacterium]|nr:hypothetical protein [Planctomycetota bacterium]
MNRFVPCILFVLALAVPLAAQATDPPEVAFTGVVEPFDGVIIAICAQPSHQLACSEGTYFLTSSTLDLNVWLGKNVKLYGKPVSDLCPLYDIHKVESPPPATLAICGTGGLGCPIRLRSGPGGISMHALWVSLKPDLVPLNPSKGSFLLAQPFYLLGIQSGGFPAEGAAFDLSIPAAPILAGVTLYFQSARRDVGPVGPLHLANAVCMEIVGFVLICHDPDC